MLPADRPATHRAGSDPPESDTGALRLSRCVGGTPTRVCRRAQWGTAQYVSVWRVVRRSPPAPGQPVRLGDLVDVDADHGLAQTARHLRDDVGVVVEGGRLVDGLPALGRVRRV